MSRGDCFFCLGRYLALSLLLHALVFLSRDFESLPRQRGAEVRVQVSLRPPVANLADLGRVAPLAKGRVKKEQVSSDRPKIPRSLRSTATFSKNRVSDSALPSVSNVAESSLLDEMDVALYRLALARNAGRLLGIGGRETKQDGEMVFEMVKLRGDSPSAVRLYSSTLNRARSEEILMLMQLAISQTPIPSAWEGRPVRIPLRLLLESVQGEDGSGCSSCS
jgi:hypothetical protein